MRELSGRAWQQGKDFDGTLTQLHNERLGLRRHLSGFVNMLYASRQKRVALDHFFNAEPFQTLAYRMPQPIGRAEMTYDIDYRAHLEQRLQSRIVYGGIFLQNNAYLDV